MIPGIMSGSGGGNSITSPSSSSLDVKQSFENQLGGNAGITFGRDKTVSITWGIVAGVVALVLGARYLKKRG